MGEIYDARPRTPVGSRPGSMTRPGRRSSPTPRGTSSRRAIAPVRRTKELAPKAITEPKPGVLSSTSARTSPAGRGSRSAAPRGTTVTLRFAEMLNPDGTIYTTNLRGAKCTDTYILQGRRRGDLGAALHLPRLPVRRGDGYPAKPAPDAVTGIVLDSRHAADRARSSARTRCSTSSTATSSGASAATSSRSRPTARSATSAWAGPATPRSSSARRTLQHGRRRLLHEVAGRTSTTPSARTARSPTCRPTSLRRAAPPAWGDAGVICPWTIYQVYGDTRILERHYDGMARWVEYCREAQQGPAPRRPSGYGDWLIDRRRHAEGRDRHRLLRLQHRASWRRWRAVLGKEDEAAQIRGALRRRSRRPSTRPTSPRTGGSRATRRRCYLMALALRPPARTRSARRPRLPRRATSRARAGTSRRASSASSTSCRP